MSAAEGGEQPRMTIRVSHLDKARNVIGRRPEVRVMGGQNVNPYALSLPPAPCKCTRCNG
jgi:hypothetical protein